MKRAEFSRLLRIIIGLRSSKPATDKTNPIKDITSETMRKPLCPESLSLKYVKRRLITLENPSPPNWAKSIEKDTSSLRRPISSVANILGKIIAVVINPMPTPIYE